ncbi:retrovirus-related pol polyprotein from transposon TNT 1-94 [Tanacetum coccineum]
MAIEVPQTLEYRGGQLNAAPVLEDFQDSPDDEDDTKSSQEYLNDLDEEYQARALLAKFKRFFKKGTQSSFISVTLSTKLLSSSQHKLELRHTKDFEAKYNKVKAKLALLSSSTSTSKALMVKNNGLIVEAYEWDEEEVSSDDNDMVEVKVLMALAEDNNAVSKEGARNGEWLHNSNKVNQCISEQIHTQKKRIMGVDQLTEGPSSFGQKDLVFVKSSADDAKVSIPGVERPWLSEAEVAVTDSSTTDYDLADESSVCSTLLPPLKKLDGVEPVSGPKTIKSILRSKSTFKAETLKGVIINEPSSAPARGNKSTSASKVNLAPAGKLKSVKIKDDPPLAICERTSHKTYDHAEYMSTMNMSKHLKNQGRSSSRSRTPRPSKHFFPPCIHYGFNDHLSDDCVNYPICDICGSYDHDIHGHNRIISLRRGIKPKNPQHVMKSCETCGSLVHTTTDHNDIEWFRRGEALQAKKAEALKSNKAKSSNSNRSKTHTKSQLYDAKYIVQFDEKRGTIFNSNKEVLMIALRVKDVYVLDMTSSTQEFCFFAKASKNLNWLWHKRLAHLNFKTINSLAKQNLVIGLCHTPPRSKHEA